MSLIKTIVIPGKPVVLKNSKQISVRRGRVFVRSNDRVLARMDVDVALVKAKWNAPPISLGIPISLKIISYGPWFSRDKSKPDASNLLCFPEDVLERAGVIENDRQVEHHDGSRRVCLCDECPDTKFMPVKSKYNKCGAVKKCPYQQVVIGIYTAFP